MEDNIHRRPPSSHGSIEQSRMPVLFHLRDVSRPRPPATGGAPDALAQARDATHAFSEEAEAVALAAPPNEAVGHDQPAPPMPQDEPQYVLLAAEESSLLPASEPISASLELSLLAEAAASNAALAMPTSLPTESPQTVERPARRFKSPPTERWFAAHGKFIAAGFVLALIGTIYLARTTRKATLQSPQVAHNPPLLADTEIASSPTISMPKPAEFTAFEVSANRAVTAPTEPKVELQLPVAAPPDNTTAAIDKPASSDNLFNFPPANRPEERLAARTDIATASLTTPAAATTPPAATTASMPAAYPVTTSPSLYQEATPAAPSYPRTSAPAFVPAMPPAGTSPFPAIAPPPLPAAPATGAAPAAYGPPVGTQARAWPAPSGAPLLPGPYQSTETTARGPRYERTGSGNY